MVTAECLLPRLAWRLPNGIDPPGSPSLPARARTARSSPLVLGFVGFVPLTGMGWMGDQGHGGPLREPARALVVVGDGPARPELESQTAALGTRWPRAFTGLAARDAAPD